MKKSLSIILSLAMVCTMSATAFAADSSTDLSAIADATIQVTQTTSESGAITNTFNNLDDFVNAVHTANPAISDYEIATYILDYTGQKYQDLPEEEILSSPMITSALHLLMYELMMKETPSFPILTLFLQPIGHQMMDI